MSSFKSGLKTKTKTWCWTQDSHGFRSDQKGGRKGHEVGLWGAGISWSEFWSCAWVQFVNFHHVLHLPTVFFLYLLLQWTVLEIGSKAFPYFCTGLVCSNLVSYGYTWISSSHSYKLSWPSICFWIYCCFYFSFFSVLNDLFIYYFYFLILSWLWSYSL